MADVDGYGSLVGTRGRQIPLANTALTEGSLEEVQTDSNFVGCRGASVFRLLE